MSKSIGNVLIVRDILKSYKPQVLRLFFLQKHYRSPINYSEEILEDAQRGWERLQNLFDNLNSIEIDSNSLQLKSLTNKEKEFKNFQERIKQEFISAMEDDFNTALAIGKVFELVKECNIIITRGNLTENQKLLLVNVKEFIVEVDEILSILDNDEHDSSGEEELSKVLDLLVGIRSELRKNKLWDLSDKIREELASIGYVIEDQPEKSIWKKEKT